jgi:hypothetical protein
MPFEVISAILSHSSLRLKDEDSLYAFLRSQFDKDRNFSSLFEILRFEYLSCESMTSFLDIVADSFDILTIPIWLAISHRLSLAVSPNHQNDRLAESSGFIEHACQLTEGSPLNGIIAYLTRKCGSNVVDHGIISITASSAGSAQSYPLRNIADFASQNFYYTANQPNSWVCYDFKTMRIKLSHYSLRSQSTDDKNFLRSWVLEGSLEGQSWIELDRHENNSALTGRGATATFPVSHSSAFQFIRLRQIGKNNSNSDNLELCAIEFFGVLAEPKQ